MNNNNKKNKILKSGITITRIFFILIFIFLILLSGCGIVAFLITFLENRFELKGFLFLIGFYLVVVGLSLWGLILQIKSIKKEKNTEIVEYTDELNIHFESQISYKDYRNFMLRSMTKLYFIFFTFLCFIVYISLRDIRYDFATTIILTAIIFILILILVLRRTRNNYQTNKMFHEQINYTLDNTAIHSKNESIDSTVLWTRYYKIKETKNFFLLYPDKTVVSLLPKKAFKAEELEAFRKFAKSLPLRVEVFEKSTNNPISKST
jgi:hypothetical protein